MATGVATAPLYAPTPSLRSALREASGLVDIARLAWASRSFADEPRGDGSRVIVLPGFGADDWTTWPLRRFLRGQGWDARPWGFGRNTADVPEDIERMSAVVDAAASELDRPVSLVGWSLGGYLAREVARERPEAVRRVVTLGSPVIGGPKYTTVGALASARNWDFDEIEAFVEGRKKTPLRVPVTAIYSRHDNIVAWPACVDPEDGGPIEHVEVVATHIGLGFNPDVYRLLARRLAAD